MWCGGFVGGDDDDDVFELVWDFWVNCDLMAWINEM